jgi:hypothetical protein
MVDLTKRQNRRVRYKRRWVEVSVREMSRNNKYVMHLFGSLGIEYSTKGVGAWPNPYILMVAIYRTSFISMGIQLDLVRSAQLAVAVGSLLTVSLPETEL